MVDLANPSARAVRETGGPTTLTVGAIADGQVLTRSGATIVGTAGGGGGSPSGSAGGDLASTYPNPQVAAIHETGGPTQLTFGAIVDGDVLVRSGTTIIGQVGAAPTGSAGGDLGSTYPNPQVAAIHETAGPTKLTIGSIPDGDVLVRSGTTLIGQAGAAPTGSAGGDLTGTYPNPTIAALAVTAAKIANATITDTQVAAANKDGTAGTASLRTLGTGAAQAAAGNDSRLSDSRAPNGTAGGDLGSTYPNPQVAAIHETSGPTKLTIGSIPDGDVLIRSGSTLIGQAGAAPIGSAGGDLTGTYPNPTIAALAVTASKIANATITDTQVAAANKDGTAGTASMRTLGTGSTQATAGNDSRLSDSRTPTGSAGGDLGSTYPNPQVAAIHETGGPTKLTIGAVADGQTLIRSGTTLIGTSATGGPPTGSAGGDLASTYPNPQVAAVHETGGPTQLTFGAIADTQYLVRSGSTVIGSAGTSGTAPITRVVATNYSIADSTQAFSSRFTKVNGGTKLTLGSGSVLKVLGSVSLKRWSPDVAPGMPSSKDDEMDGNSVASKWTTWDPGGVLTKRMFNGHLELSTNAAGIKLAGLYQTVPSNEFAIYSKMGVDSTFTDASVIAFLFVSEDLVANPTTADLITGEIFSTSAPVFQGTTRRWSAYNGTTSGQSSNLTVIPHGVYMRIRVLNATVSTDISVDGSNWLTFQTVTFSGTPAHMGVGVISQTTAATRHGNFKFFRCFPGMGTSGKDATSIGGYA